MRVNKMEGITIQKDERILIKKNRNKGSCIKMYRM